MKIKILGFLSLLLLPTDAKFNIISTGPQNSSLQQTPFSGSRSIKPKESFCSTHRIRKLRCSETSLHQCYKQNPIETDSQYQPVCAYNTLGVQHQFNNKCDACEVPETDFYFEGACNSEEVPQLCAIKEGCINGICVDMSKEDLIKDNGSCNSKSDCINPSHTCVANKCVDKRSLFKALKEVQQHTPQLIEENDRVKKRIRKWDSKRREEEQKEGERIKRVNKQRRQRREQRRKMRDQRKQQRKDSKDERREKRKTRKQQKRDDTQNNSEQRNQKQRKYSREGRRY